MNRRFSRTNEDGATVVEFAVVAPLLFLLLFGIIELARVGFAFAEVWTAAREGARYATVYGDADTDSIPNFVDCDGIEAAALAKVTVESLNGGDVEIVYRAPGGAVIANCQGGPFPTETGNIDPGTTIRVRVEGTFDAVVPVIERFLDGVVLDNSQTRSVNYGPLDA
jgi:Flp pilus assembly protein TadG